MLMEEGDKSTKVQLFQLSIENSINHYQGRDVLLAD